MGEVERLGIVKFQRSRKIDREIIAQLILRERRAITIGDLTARRIYVRASFCVSNVGTISWSIAGGDGSGEGAVLGATEDAGPICCPVALENAKSIDATLSIIVKRLIR